MIKSNCFFGISVIFFLVAVYTVEAFKLRGLLSSSREDNEQSDSKLDISYGDTHITRGESGNIEVETRGSGSERVELDDEQQTPYCSSFPNNKSKDNVSMRLLHGVTYSDYIGSTYFQSSYQIENISKDKKMCGMKIEIPGSEDMKVFISTGINFDEKRIDEGTLKGNLVKDSVYVEPGDVLTIFYTLSEDTDLVESRKVPQMCIADYEICSTKELENRTPITSWNY